MYGTTEALLTDVDGHGVWEQEEEGQPGQGHGLPHLVEVVDGLAG